MVETGREMRGTGMTNVTGIGTAKIVKESRRESVNGIGGGRRASGGQAQRVAAGL